jgi:hypothetical protein
MPTLGGHTNVVTSVSYNCSANDGTNTVDIEGVVQLSPSGNPFVEFAALTFLIVDGWVKAVLGENGIISVEACLQGQLDSLANPPVNPESVPFPF